MKKCNSKHGFDRKICFVVNKSCKKLKPFYKAGTIFGSFNQKIAVVTTTYEAICSNYN